MNILNIDKTIAIMERAKARDSVYMPHWQTLKDKSLGYTKTEEEFHACGNTACLAGHIAVSPEWQADGGAVTWNAVAEMQNRVGEDAIAAWWGVNDSIAYAFIYSYNQLYPVPWEQVKAYHVLEKLHELKDLGEKAFAEKYNIYSNESPPVSD